ALHRIHRSELDVMVHATGRHLHLFTFDAKHRTDMLAIRTLYFHVLFDLRSIDHGDYLLPLARVLRTKRRAKAPSGQRLWPTTLANSRASGTTVLQVGSFKEKRRGAR